MFCKNCGTQLPDGSKFCTSCGTSLEPTESQPQGAAQQPVYQQPVYQQPVAPKASNPYIPAALAYIPILFWLPLISEPKTPFGKACANQGLVALIFQAIIGVASAIVSGILVGFVTWNNYGVMTMLITLFNLVFAALSIAIGVCCIIGIVKAWKGQFFEIPVIGKIIILR